MTAVSLRDMLKRAINPGIHVRKFPSGTFVALHEYQSWVSTICVEARNLHTNEKFPGRDWKLLTRCIYRMCAESRMYVLNVAGSQHKDTALTNKLNMDKDIACC